uniref:Uncharacterized protein LOC114347807 n=2 Tax=Diabrotica virgifera virgifera TaxID=50390 RepID=A0A6P7H6U8_DIAVI
MYYADSRSSGDSRVYTADLQKVIMLPRCDTFKEIIFTPRLIAFNESFVPVGTSKTSTVAVLWHEAISGRKKADIVSTFYAFLNKIRDSEEVVIWLDNCSGQNKNWCLYTFFVYAVSSLELNIRKITLRYFESGHTFMAADSFHHRVEQSLNRKGKVYDFVDFVDAVKTSTRNVEVIDMAFNDFYNWKDESSQYKITRLVPRPYLQQMVEVQFIRGFHTFGYKTSFEGEIISANFLKANIQKNGIAKPLSISQPRGITMERKQNIITKIGQIMPPNRIAFWKNIFVSENVDTIDD